MTNGGWVGVKKKPIEYKKIRVQSFVCEPWSWVKPIHPHPLPHLTQMQCNSRREQGQDDYSLFIAHNMDGVGPWVRIWTPIVQVSKYRCLFSGSASPFPLTRTNMFAWLKRDEKKKKKKDVLQGVCGLPLTLTLTLTLSPCSLFAVPCTLYPVPCFPVPLSLSLSLSVNVCLFGWCFVVNGEGEGTRSFSPFAPLVQNVMRTRCAQGPKFKCIINCLSPFLRMPNAILFIFGTCNAASHIPW